MAQKEELIPDTILMTSDVKLKDTFVCASYPVCPTTTCDNLSNNVISYLETNFIGDNTISGNSTSAFISENTTVSVVKDLILDALSSIGLSKKNFNEYISLFQYGNEVLITAVKY